MSQMDPQPVPPVSGDFRVPVEPPAWPKVVGIISIVLASLSLVCGGCGLIQNAMSVAGGGKDAQMPSGKTVHIPAPSGLSLALGGLGWLWAILLLAAGIMVVRRMPIGRVLHLVYAGVSLVLTIAATAVAVADMGRIFEAFNQDPQMAQMAGIIKGVSYGAVCFGIALGIGYPIFLLVWFGALGKRPEAGALPQEPLV